jgi:MFS family permease
MQARPRPNAARLPRAVFTFGWISLATDIASEAIYPLLPIYLTAVIGARPAAVGLIEGVADATSSLLKLVSGWLSDRLARRRALVVAGYTLASLVRPLVGLAWTWPQVLALRFLDRVGKGVRGAPRDAILAHVAPPEMRGRVFGVQRAMDHTGAVLGPLLASAFLLAWPGEYRALFLCTIVPGLLVIVLLTRVPADRAASEGPAPAPARPGEWRSVPPRVLAVMGVVLLFTLGNSTDAFLLLRLSGAGLPVAALPIAWSALHVVKVLASLAGGHLADRLDRRAVLAAGWLVYAAVYGGFAVATTVPALIGCFLVYGVYFGLTEGVEKALLADLAPARLRATVFGLHGFVTGVGALGASVLGGVLWEMAGPAAAFGAGALLSLAAAALIWPAARPALTAAR